jgi:RimJ/RimL family protein N-acetyltransferase
LSDLHAAPRLETGRLILRACRQSDIEPFIAMMAEPEVARFLTSTQAPMDRADAWRALAMSLGHWSLHAYGLFVVEEKASGVFIGRVGAWRPEGRAETELGWGFSRAAWGKGYAQEAARAAGDWMFSALALARIASFIHIDNERSQKLARRLGMAPGGETFHAGMPHAIWRVDRAGWAG